LTDGPRFASFPTTIWNIMTLCRTCPMIVEFDCDWSGYPQHCGGNLLFTFLWKDQSFHNILDVGKYLCSCSHRVWNWVSWSANNSVTFESCPPFFKRVKAQLSCGGLKYGGRFHPPEGWWLKFGITVDAFVFGGFRDQKQDNKNKPWNC
jgi:hypothetical protein